jgi:hypothetical protein
VRKGRHFNLDKTYSKLKTSFPELTADMELQKIQSPQMEVAVFAEE